MKRVIHQNIPDTSRITVLRHQIKNSKPFRSYESSNSLVYNRYDNSKSTRDSAKLLITKIKDLVFLQKKVHVNFCSTMNRFEDMSHLKPFTEIKNGFKFVTQKQSKIEQYYSN